MCEKELPDTEEQKFYFPSHWRTTIMAAGIGSLGIALGMGLGEVAERVAQATESFFPACLIGLFAVGIALVGFLILFFVAQRVLIHSLSELVGHGVVMISLSPESITIANGFDPYETEVIANSDIVWVKSEITPRNKRYVRIVFGAHLKTTYIADLREADFDALLGILKERCPAAFGDVPPVGYEAFPYPQTEPPYDSVSAQPNVTHVYPFGRKVSEGFTWWTLGALIGIALAVLCTGEAMILGTQGALNVLLGCFSLFLGLSFILIVHKFHWLRLYRFTKSDKRRDELRLTSQGLSIHNLIHSEKPTRVAFDKIRAIYHETIPERIWIVGSSKCQTLEIPRRWMEGSDFDSFLAFLREHLPEAFVTPLSTLSFGPTLRRRLLFYSPFIVLFPIVFGGAIWLSLESLSWGGWRMVLTCYCGGSAVLGGLFNVLMFIVFKKWKTILPGRPGLLSIANKSLTVRLDSEVQHVPFSEIRHITLANCRGTERLWIVHSESLATLQLSQRWFSPEDYEALLAFLNHAAPEPFNSHPPTGWEAPKYSRYPEFGFCE
jgi:hypothetical protein